MARIYSNSFFHYTTQEGLLGILKEGFKATYCKEQFKNKEGEIKYIGIPMISFCDIPLSLLSEVVYGDRGYAIGMKREWGLKKCLIPVFYFSNEDSSMIQKAMQRNCSNFYKIRREKNKTKFSYKILGMSKPIQKFSDDDYTRGKIPDNYKEREWRKVFYKELWKDETEYQKWRGEQNDPKPMLSKKMTFDVNDIDFIILENNTDVHTFIEKIQSSDFQICNKKIEEKDKYLLVAKIITKDQITNNF